MAERMDWETKGSERAKERKTNQKASGFSRLFCVNIFSRDSL